MKYVLILGQNYRDCKAKLDSIEGQPETRYTLVTKPKHVGGLGFSSIIETDNAKANPLYREIKQAIKLEKKSIKVVPEPVVEEIPEPIIEEYDNEEVDWKSTENFPVEPEPIDEEFEKELEALIEKDEDVKEDEYVVDPNDELMPEEPTVEELVEDQLEEEEDVKEELEEMGLEYEPVDEEVPEPEVEEVPEPEVEEPVEEIVSEVPLSEELPEEELVDEEIPERPVGDAPRGWHARLKFIDEAGNVFSKGKYMGIMGRDGVFVPHEGNEE
jgi:hypothetical protein